MISHKHKVIFVHIPRTGGSSIESALVGSDWWEVEEDTKHLTHEEAKQKYKEYWDSYLKIASVRNPWDWLVSLYYSHGRPGGKTWQEFLDEPLLAPHEQDEIIQSRIIGTDIDLVLRFEDLQNDFNELCRRLELNLELPVVERGAGDRLHYSSYFTPSQAEQVSKVFSEDLERFGYTFQNQFETDNIDNDSDFAIQQRVDLAHKLRKSQVAEKELRELNRAYFNAILMTEKELRKFSEGKLWRFLERARAINFKMLGREEKKSVISRIMSRLSRLKDQNSS